MIFWIVTLCQIFFGGVALGGVAYLSLAIFSVRAFRRKMTLPRRNPEKIQPITALKPLRGAEPELEACLTGFFLQEYPQFEILFAVREEDDPAVAVVRRLMERFPQVSARLIVTGTPPFPNAKVYSMSKMSEIAKYDLFVITDSDTAVAPDYFSSMNQVFADAKIGAATNLYRGAGGRDFWARLEALGMSTEFMAGVIVAERLEGMKFALGPSMAIRRECLAAFGGFPAMKDFLADDFILGHWAERAGYQVALSPHVVEHYASTSGFRATFAHRLRWNRSSRFSRPDGYFGQGFTYAVPWTLLFACVAPFSWGAPALALVVTLRCWLAVALGRGALGDASVVGRLWMIPLQDCMSWATWIGAFFGRTVVWRNETYRLLAEGRFEPIKPRVQSPR
jgi:ceramide glucosyltransferase